MNVLVERKKDNGTETVGMLSVFNDSEKVFECDTLELPNKNNMNNISCIPAGQYICSKVGASTNIPYPHIAIQNVPGRSGVCIHIANYVSQLKGCIAVGASLVDMNGDGELDTSSSKVTFDKLMSILEDSFVLTIKQ